MSDPVALCKYHGEYSLHTGCFGCQAKGRALCSCVACLSQNTLVFTPKDVGEPYCDVPLAPTESQRRKATPIFSGVMRYFPDALAAVARVSKAGNDKHNPGQPLHWSREKSSDHGDCIARHQLTFDQIDPEIGEYHAALVAWRALAQLQLLEEGRRLTDLSGPMGRPSP